MMFGSRSEAQLRVNKHIACKHHDIPLIEKHQGKDKAQVDAAIMPLLD